MHIVTDIAQLRKKTKPVKKVSEGVKIGKTLIEYIDYLAKAGRGAIGLAANQLGIDKSVCVIVENRNSPVILVNPTIVRWDGVSAQSERCLSLPGIESNTIRYASISVQADNLKNNEEFEKFRAIVAQHEISHLFGLLMSDFDGSAPTPDRWREWNP